MAYVIDRQLCSGCDACSSVCPTNAISHDAKAEKNSIDAEYRTAFRAACARASARKMR